MLNDLVFKLIFGFKQFERLNKGQYGILHFMYSVKQLQSNLSTRVRNGKLQMWPLLTGGLCSECQKLPVRVSRDNLRLSFVDSKPLLAGVLMHRFDCIYNGYVTLKFSFFSCDNKCYIPVCSMRASYPF